MCVIVGCGADDIFGCEPDPFVGDIHAAIACAGRNLFSAVGVSIEARFADKEFQATTKCVTDQIDLFA